VPICPPYDPVAGSRLFFQGFYALKQKKEVFRPEGESGDYFYDCLTVFFDVPAFASIPGADVRFSRGFTSITGSGGDKLFHQNLMISAVAFYTIKLTAEWAEETSCLIAFLFLSFPQHIARYQPVQDK
jgi:hypothetical protein